MLVTPVNEPLADITGPTKIEVTGLLPANKLKFNKSKAVNNSRSDFLLRLAVEIRPGIKDKVFFILRWLYQCIFGTTKVRNIALLVNHINIRF